MGIFSKTCDNPRYSLIVVNFQSAVVFGRMLRSLPASFLSEGEVLLVNNDVREQGFLERMLHQCPGVRIIDAGGNGGFARACNRGAQEASGEVLFFLNPDTHFIQGSFQELFSVFETGDGVIIAPRLLQRNRSEPWSSGRIVSPLQIFLQNLIPLPSFWSFVSRRSLGWVSGAALILSRRDFERLGGFDEAYFLYYEDVDLCRRAKARGMVILKNQDVVLSHRGSVSHAGRTEEQKRVYFRSQERYIGKYYHAAWIPLLRSLRRFRFFLCS